MAVGVDAGVEVAGGGGRGRAIGCEGLRAGENWNAVVGWGGGHTGERKKVLTDFFFTSYFLGVEIY
jgi:hypothetical protein